MTEAVLLTGGEGRRMGLDKATLMVHGEPVAVRTARELQAAGCRVTVLGREPLDGCVFLPDAGLYQGPLVALSRFEPRGDRVFVASCDMPFFSGQLVIALAALLEDSDAVIPLLDGRRQTLCALYRGQAWFGLRELVSQGERRLFRWVETLRVRETAAEELGVNERSLRSANSPEEWASLLANGPL